MKEIRAEADLRKSVLSDFRRSQCRARLDNGIRKAVEIPERFGIETFESCEGGLDHSYTEPNHPEPPATTAAVHVLEMFEHSRSRGLTPANRATMLELLRIPNVPRSTRRPPCGEK